MKTFFLIFSLTVCFSVQGQIKKQKLRKTQNSYCRKDNNLSVPERQKLFPFSLAKSVVIFSYDPPKKYSKDTIYYWGDEKPLPVNGFIIDSTNFKFDTTKIIFKKYLSSADLNSLTDIFYNFSSKGFSDENGMTLPLNGIYFLGNDNEIIGYVFFSFDWTGYSKSSDKINLGNWCSIKFKILKQFYIEKGIPVKSLK